MRQFELAEVALYLVLTCQSLCQAFRLLAHCPFALHVDLYGSLQFAQRVVVVLLHLFRLRPHQLEVLLEGIEYLRELFAVDGREFCRTLLEDALGGGAHLFAQQSHLLRHLLLLLLHLLLLGFLLSTHLLLKGFALLTHLLLLRLLHRLHLLPERFLLVAHLLAERISLLLFLLFGQGDTFLACLHLRAHGKEDSQCSQSDADDEIQKIYEFHSHCLMIVQCKDTKKTLMSNVQCSIIFEAYLFNYVI